MPPADAAGLKIPCATPHQLQIELDALATALEPEEREDTWEKFEKAVIRFAGVTRGGGYKHMDVFVRGVGNKGVGLRLVDCMMSDRGRLSGVSTDLLQTMAPRLGMHFAPLVNLYVPPLVRLLARPNKVYFRRADKCLTTIIHHCPLPAILIHLRHGLDDRSDQCKRASGAGIEAMLEHWEPSRLSEKDLELLELCVRKMATDRDSEVRKTAKRVWAQFMDHWPERVEDFTDPLTPTIRRYLDIPAGDALSKPKPRAALRPRPAAAVATAKDAPLGAPMTTHIRNGNAAHPVRDAPVAVAGPSRVRSTSRTAPVEQRPRVVSGHSRAAEHAPASRSASHGVLNHMSSSSSLGSATDSVRHNVLSKPSRPVLYFKEKETEPAPPRRLAAPARTVSSSSEPSETRPQRTGASRNPAMRPLPSFESLPRASGSAPATEQSSPMTSVKKRVSELEKKGGDVPSVFRLSPSKRDLAIAAAVPLPAETPTQAKPAAQARPPASESPSLSMLLQRGRDPPDAPDMPTLLDLSVDVAAMPDAVPRRQLSQTLREPSPSPGTVAGLIGRFSGTQTAETPGPARPQRSSSLSTPSTSSSAATAHLATTHTDDSAAEGTPTPAGDHRRISPLPRRRSRLSDPPAPSPPRRLKRKSSNDFDVALAAETEESEGSTPVPAAPPRAPRFSQPLIAFSDTPSRRQSVRPFVFGASSGAGVFDDLMGIQTGEDIAEEDEGDVADMFAGLVIGSGEHGDGEVDADETVHAGLIQIDRETEIHPTDDHEAQPTEDPDVAEALVETESAGDVFDEPEDVPGLLEVHEKAINTPAAEEPALEEPAVRAAVEEAAIEEPFGDSTETSDEQAADEPTQEAPRTPAQDVHEVVDAAPSELEHTVDDGAEAENVDKDHEHVPLAVLEETTPKPAPLENDTPVAPSAAADAPKAAPAVVEAAHELLRTVAAAKASAASRPARAPAASHTTSQTTATRPTTSRLGPPSRAVPSRPQRPPPTGEKKSFRPVSRLGPAEGGKGAPAPARLATATKASAAKVAASHSHKAPETRTASTASVASTKPSSRHTSRAASPVGEIEEGLAASQSSNGSRKPARSNLLKPTAAAAARAAANAEAAAAKPRPAPTAAPTRAPVPAPAPAPRAAVPAPHAPRRAGAAFGSTASSRARAEASLPPVKRQRVKLKAPMESFRPGRARANVSKAAAIGTAPPPRVRPRPQRKLEGGTFPLPGPGLAPAKPANDADEASDAEGKKAETAPQRPATAALAIPGATRAADDTVATPTTLSPLAAASLSPSSSRLTDRSDASVRSGSSPRKMRAVTPTRVLDPVLTPLHSRVAASVSDAAGAESPATAHARRMSGINLFAAVTPRPASKAEVIAEEHASGDDEHAGLHVPRHDVSTPPAKAAAALLAKFGALHLHDHARAALTPKDANRDIDE